MVPTIPQGRMPPLQAGNPRPRFHLATVRWNGETTIRVMLLLAEIAAKGRDGWKEASGYHRRSIAETMMYRLKQLGDRLFSRAFDRQVAESYVRAAIINQLAYLSMPNAVRAGRIAPPV